MSLLPEYQQQLLAATREAAAAFIEDMPYIRETVNKPNPDRGGLRRLSNVLRRLLIDKGGDLPDIAAPRIGKVTIVTPDNKPVYKDDRRRPYAFFGSGGTEVFGVWLRAAMVEHGSRPRPLQDFDPSRCITLPMDNFLSQQVLCLQGRWVTRRDAIKYIANIASGVHSGSPKKDIEKLIARIRKSGSYMIVGDAVSIAFKMDALYPTEPPFQYEPKALDPVLVEVLATAHLLAQSPDLRELELVVQHELSVAG